MSVFCKRAAVYYAYVAGFVRREASMDVEAHACM